MDACLVTIIPTSQPFRDHRSHSLSHLHYHVKMMMIRLLLMSCCTHMAVLGNKKMGTYQQSSGAQTDTQGDFSLPALFPRLSLIWDPSNATISMFNGPVSENPKMEFFHASGAFFFLERLKLTPFAILQSANFLSILEWCGGRQYVFPYTSKYLQT